MNNKFQIQADLGKFKSSLDLIVDQVGGTVRDHMPYVAAGAVKWAMNKERVPTPEKVKSKARNKAGAKVETDYKSNAPGSVTKNVYINTGGKFGKTHLAVRNHGQTYYPLYSPSDFAEDMQTHSKSGNTIRWSNSSQAFIRSQIEEYKRALAVALKNGRDARLLAKTPWYDMLKALEKRGVKIDDVSPKSWTGGRKGIEKAKTLHNGNPRPPFGFARFAEDPDGFLVIVHNTYPAWAARKMNKRIEAGARVQSAKIVNDYKRGAFKKLQSIESRYPWIKFQN
jgi:hypothetical protein